MRLFLLAALTMIAFAANSVLNRLGVLSGVDPLSFAVIRLVSGAVALAVLVWLTGGAFSLRGRKRVFVALALAVYMLGFSLAYITLDAGVGALILFGVVQMTVFGGVLIGGAQVSAAKWIGTAVALAGLAYLLLPGATSPDLWGAVLMAFAGAGWGVYTLLGRSEPDALGATTGNFIVASLLVAVFAAFWPADRLYSATGVSYALVSGALTSAMGYALWYRILPRLEAATAGIAQLTVPVIALAGGMVFLGEAVTLGFVLASALVLGGVAWSILRG
ncbi:MAG: DMT family transporter [Litoreibacter sp.]|nr:DMT family transporter [Litoreibacter sp.]